MSSSAGQYEHLISGFMGGICSTLICHPMDLLKIRYSANEGNPLRPQYTSYLDAVKKITAAEGLPGMYKGLTPNLTGAAISWGIYFEIYHHIRSLVVNESTSSLTRHSSSFACAYLSGAAVMCITNPIWLTKTRLCLQYENKSSKQYSGMMDCLYQTAKYEGIRGLYKGFVAGLIGASHGATQMMIYSHMKDTRCIQLGIPIDSKLCTLQDHNAAYEGFFKTIKQTIKGEGISGLYKGLLMANARTLPASVITFLVYEQVRYLLKELKKS